MGNEYGRTSQQENFMSSINRRSGIDRRRGYDRRQIHDLAYFEQGGIERRCGGERRKTSELRAGWTRVSPWSSVKKDVILEPEEFFPLP